MPRAHWRERRGEGRRGEERGGKGGRDRQVERRNRKALGVNSRIGTGTSLEEEGAKDTKTLAHYSRPSGLRT